MEVHARYTLVGLFALAVLGTGFAFVYWLETGGLAERIVYRIRYDGPVAGLAKGSLVLFNGVRIGEVTALKLDAASPGSVGVEVAVDRAAPIRADTRAGIDFQGLAGAPAVALTGGSAALPVLAKAGPAEHVLQAEPNAGQSVTQSARDVLRNVDTVVTENAAALKSAIANIDKFTGALARNSDKVDGVMAGLERLTGGGSKAALRMIELAAVTKFPAIAVLPRGQLQIPEPTALAHLEADRIVVGGDGLGQLDAAQWADALPRVVQAAMVRSFENAGYNRVLGRAPDGVKVDYQLLLDIRRFQIERQPDIRAEVEIGARILKSDGSLSEVKVFRARVAAGGLAPQVATLALAEAFDKVAAEIVVWACGALA